MRNPVMGINLQPNTRRTISHEVLDKWTPLKSELFSNSQRRLRYWIPLYCEMFFSKFKSFSTSKISQVNKVEKLPNYIKVKRHIRC